MSYLHDEYRDIVTRLREAAARKFGMHDELFLEAAEAIENLMTEVEVAGYRGDD